MRVRCARASPNARPTRALLALPGTTTRDFTAEVAEDAENGRKQGNATKTTGDLDTKAQRNSPFSAFSAASAVKK